MAKITYTDKVSVATGSNEVNEWRDNNANEVKSVVNSNDSVSISTSNTVLFDRIQGYRHGSWVTPITGTIILNTAGSVEGGCAVVVWNGSSSPTFTGGTIQSYSGNITESGTYSIYIHYLNGRFNVNVFNVEGHTEVDLHLFSDDFAGTTINLTKWDDNQIAGVSITQNDGLILTPSGAGDGVLYDSYLIAKNTVTLAAETIVTFDIQSDDDTDTADYHIGLWGGTDATITTDRFGGINTSAVDQQAHLGIKTGETLKYSQTFYSILTTKTIKISIKSDAIRTYIWGGSDWGTATGYTATGFDLDGLSWYPIIASNNKTGKTTAVNIYNFVVTNVDFLTQRP